MYVSALQFCLINYQWPLCKFTTLPIKRTLCYQINNKALEGTGFFSVIVMMGQVLHQIGGRQKQRLITGTTELETGDWDR